MAQTFSLHRYFAALPVGKMALWCYLIWYLLIVALYFDPSPAIWRNALGISAVVGVALMLSVDGPRRIASWQTVRLFLMPFCVSSFSALIKGHAFVLILPPSLPALAILLGSCGVFVIVVLTVQRLSRLEGSRPR